MKKIYIFLLSSIVSCSTFAQNSILRPACFYGPAHTFSTSINFTPFADLRVFKYKDATGLYKAITSPISTPANRLLTAHNLITPDTLHPINSLCANGNCAGKVRIITDDFYTVAADDWFVNFAVNNGTINLPVAWGWPAREIRVFNGNDAGNKITINSAGGLIYGNGTKGASITLAALKGCSLVSDGVNWLAIGL